MKSSENRDERAEVGFQGSEFKRSRVRSWIVPGVVALLLMPALLFCGRMASTLWPGLHYDSVLYSTVVVNKSLGESFRFDAYTPALLNRPGGDMGDHGLLSYVIYGAAMNDGTYGAYFRASSAITFFSVCLMALLLFLQTRSFGWWAVLVPAAGGWLLLAVLVQIHGRPEHLIPLVVILCELAVRLGKLGVSSAGLLRGVCCGLVAAISPAPAVLYATGLAMYYFAVFSWAELLKVGALAAAASALTWSGLTVFLFGNSPWAAFAGAAGSDIDYRARSLAHHQWFFNANTPWIGLLYGQTLALLVASALRRVVHDKWPLLAGAAGLLLLGALLLAVDMTGVKNPFVNYRSIPFVPLWLLFLCAVVLVGQPPAPSTQKWWLVLNRAAFAIFLLLTTLGGARFLWERYREAGAEASAFAETKAAYDALKAKLGPNERIGMDQFGSASDIVLDGPPWSMLSFVFDSPEFVESLEEAEEKLGVRIVYLVRSPRFMPVPRQEIGPFVLTGQTFPEGAPAPKTYGLYIYERVDTRGPRGEGTKGQPEVGDRETDEQ